MTKASSIIDMERGTREYALMVDGQFFRDLVEKNGTTVERIVELVEADRKGRCVVLQTNCNNTEKTLKYGDIVYQADKERIYDMKIKKIIYDCGHVAFDYDAIGKTVFITRKAAEAALKGENYNE